MAALATIFFVLLAATLVPSFLEVWHAYKSGGSSVVEGVVEDFRPAPVLGSAEESFSVQGVNFSYNALDLTSCFHDTPFRKGLIRPSLAMFVSTTKADAFSGWTSASKSNARSDLGKSWETLPIGCRILVL